jgi:hypothetical protein
VRRLLNSDYAGCKIEPLLPLVNAERKRPGNGKQHCEAMRRAVHLHDDTFKLIPIKHGVISGWQMIRQWDVLKRSVGKAAAQSICFIEVFYSGVAPGEKCLPPGSVGSCT